MNGSVLSISVEHHRIPLASKWINAAGLLSGLHGSRGVELAGRRHWPSAGRAR